MRSRPAPRPSRPSAVRSLSRTSYALARLRSAESLAKKHAQLRREIQDLSVRIARTTLTKGLDLLSSSRVMSSFEARLAATTLTQDEMGHERRHLRASRFGAGLHHLMPG